MDLPLIVGEHNPYGVDPAFALYCAPHNSAGARLQRLVFAVTPETYLSRFLRVNLCVSAWNMQEARERAAQLVTGSDESRVIVLLGVKVASAARWTAGPWTHTRGIVSLPHPSGLCREWDEPGSYERARALLRRAMPEIPFGELVCGRPVERHAPGYTDTCPASSGHAGPCFSGSEVCLECGVVLRPWDYGAPGCPACGVA